MQKSKALRREENERVGSLLRDVLEVHFPGRGGQTAFADDTGVSQSHVSTTADGTKGAGVQMLRALAKYRPIEVVKLLGIKLETLLELWADREGYVMNDGLPDSMRRAARAAVELWGCSPDEAVVAAKKVMTLVEGDPDSHDPAALVGLFRPLLPRRAKSGTRPKR